MEFLPHEMVMNILSRVSTLDILRLRIVCKSWKNMIVDLEPAIIQLQYFRSNLRNNQVLLVVDDKDLCFMDMAEKAKATRKKLTSMGSSFEIIGSCGGILCLLTEQANQLTILITNPFTNQKLLLPKLDFITKEYPILACGFGYDSTTKLYKVVVFRAPIFLHSTRVMVYDGRTSNWRYVGQPSVCNFYSFYSKSLLNGRLHWITNTGIISFDLTDEKFRLIIPPRNKTYEYDRLIVIGGCLCIVSNSCVRGPRMYLGIWVMKEYGVKKSWAADYIIDVPIDEVMRGVQIRFEVLGEVENGRILVKCGPRLLVINPKHKNFKFLKFSELPRIATLHTVTLNQIQIYVSS